MTGFRAVSAASAAVATALLPLDVVERAGTGDKVAFARIVAAYHADLVRVAYVVAGDEQLAQDAAQSAWAIAWRKLGTVRDPARVRPWLATVAANEARQALRGRRRERLAMGDRTRPFRSSVGGPVRGGSRRDGLGDRAVDGWTVRDDIALRPGVPGTGSGEASDEVPASPTVGGLPGRRRTPRVLHGRRRLVRADSEPDAGRDPGDHRRSLREGAHAHGQGRRARHLRPDDAGAVGPW